MPARKPVSTDPRSIALAVAAAFAPWLVPAVNAQIAADTLPTGGQVSAGAASISTNGSKMQIDQSTGRAILNWQSFSVGSSAWVNFTQPGASSVALNRVVGNDPSQIFGRLTANGQVFLVNNAGVFFAPGTSVNVNALFASTLSINDQDFLAGRYHFFNPGNAGSVVNQGNIVTGNGYTALVAPQVRNDGVIVARTGSIALVAANRVSLDLVGDGLISINVDQAALNASIINTGTLQADGGTVLLAARSANALLDTVINNSGIIRATSLVERNGEIVLDGGSAGVVAVTGTLEAAGTEAGTTGGTVKVLGQYVGLFDHAAINASGDLGGGTVLVGGNWQGNGPKQNAMRTIVGPDATISARASTNGDGGTVVVWADDVTKFFGSIDARGGTQGGNGGSVETSGKQVLQALGSVEVSAPRGKGGLWLLDPNNITIQNAATASITVSGATDFTSNDDNAVVDTAGLSAALTGGATVRVITGNGGTNGQNGDITVLDTTTAAGDATLELHAQGSITFGANATIADGGNVLNVNLFAGTNGPAGAPGTNASTITMDATASITTGDGNVQAVANGNIQLGAINTGGAGTLTVDTSAGGSITQVAALTIGGTTTLIAGSGNDISLGAANDFSTLSVVSGNNVTLNDANAIDLGASTISGALTVAANGAITDSGALSVAGTSTFTAGAGNNITLAAANNFSTVSVVSGNNVVLTDVNAIDLGTSTIGGTLSVTAGGAITDSGALTVTGTTSLAAGAANNITLDAANDLSTVSVVSGSNVVLTDVDAIDLGASTISGSLTVTAAGAITDSGALSVAAGTSTFTAGAANNITLDGANNLSTVSVVSGNNVMLTDVNAINLGTSTISGTLSVTAGAAITDSGALTVTGTTSLVTGPASNITLDNANNFSTVLVGSANNVALTDVGGIDLGASNVNGALTVTAGGAITDSGALAVVGTSTFTAGAANSITLDNANNFSTVSVVSANNVTLNDTNAINLGSTSATGSVTVTAGGTIGVIGAVSGADVSLITNGAASDLTSNASGTISATTGTVQLSAGNDVSLGGAVNAATGVDIDFGQAAAGTFTNNAAISGTGVSVTGGANGDTFNVNTSLAAALVGGDGADSFVFAAGVVLTGALSGGLGSDTLNLSAYSTATDVVLAAAAANGYTGTATGIVTFDTIDVLSGSSTVASSLTGLNGAATWSTTSTDAGTYVLGASTLTFSNFASWTGNAGADTFNLGHNVTGTVSGGDSADVFNYSAGAIGTLTGGLGSDTIVGPNGANSWVTTAADEGTLNTQAFSSMENWTGGTAVDSFALGHNVTGTVNGGDGADVFNYSAGTIATVAGGNGIDTLVGSTSYSITGADSGSATGVTAFNGVENLTGTAASDTFSFGAAGTLSGLIDGLGAADSANYSAAATPLTVTFATSIVNVETVTGGGAGFTLAGGSSWSITAANTGTVDGITFANWHNLTGTAGADTFTLSGAGAVSGAINGLGGGDTLVGSNSYSITAPDGGTATGVGAFAGIANLTGTANADTFTVNGGSLSGGVNGLGGVDTLVGSTGYSISAADSGTATSVGTFTSMENLSGTTGADSFTLAGGSVSGTINGLGGSDTLSGSTIYSISGPNAGTATGVASFTSIETLTGTGGNDTFTLAVASFNGTLNGGAGSDTLTAANVANSWVLTSVGAGTLNTTTTFTSIETMVGGSAMDTLSGSAPGGTTTMIDPTSLAVGPLNASGGVVNLTAASLSGTGVIIADSGTFASNANVLGLGINVTNNLHMDGSATLWNFSAGSDAGSFSVANVNISVQVAGVTRVASVGQQQAAAAIGTVAEQIGATIVEEANKTFGTDSVAEDVEYGFAGEIGATPPMDHRIDESGISLPRCVEEAREGMPCK